MAKRCTFWTVAAALVAVGSASAQSPNRDLGLVNLQVPGQTKPEPLYGASHALVIGASRYTAGWNSLSGVPRDVQAVSALLRRHGFGVTELLDPSYSQLDMGLREFVARRGQAPNARLLVYYAGHGHTVITDAGNRLGYLVPVDAPRPDRDPSGFVARAYSMESIEVLARQVNAKHALFIFDSCFSGTVFRSRSSVPEHISEKTSAPVRQFITAGDENQSVPDESLFRHRLEQALGDGAADTNGDGYITGSELGVYLQDTVTDDSRRSQTPQWGKIRDPRLDRGDFVFLSPRVGGRTDLRTDEDAARARRDQWEREAWELCKVASAATACQTYADVYPRGQFIRLVRLRLDELGSQAAALLLASGVPPTDVNSVCIKMGQVQMPSVNWVGKASFQIKAQVKGGRVDLVTVAAMNMASDPAWKGSLDSEALAAIRQGHFVALPSRRVETSAMQAFRDAIEKTMKQTYDCPGTNAAIQQEFVFVVD